MTAADLTLALATHTPTRDAVGGVLAGSGIVLAVVAVTILVTQPRARAWRTVKQLLGVAALLGFLTLSICMAGDEQRPPSDPWEMRR